MSPVGIEASSEKARKWVERLWSSRTTKALIFLGIVVGACAIVWASLWPFQEGTVVQNLREASDGQVQVRAFHRTYFPSPGCVIEGAVFNPGSKSSKPLITIEKVTIRGTYLG